MLRDLDSLDLVALDSLDLVAQQLPSASDQDIHVLVSRMFSLQIGCGHSFACQIPAFLCRHFALLKRSLLCHPDLVQFIQVERD